MIRSQQSKYPKVVFCDFTAHDEETGFQRVYGSPGNLRYFAAFDVTLKYACSVSYTSAQGGQGHSREGSSRSI